MARTLTLADGRLGASAGTLLSGASAPDGKVQVVLANTGDSEQIVLLTFRLAGSTARRIARAVIEANGSAVVTGVPLQPDDTLLGQTTSADVVDYLVTRGEGDFSVTVLGADGAVQSSDTNAAATVTQTVDGTSLQAVEDATVHRKLDEMLVHLARLVELAELQALRMR